MATSFEEALAATQSWVGTRPGVVIVGEGARDGERTIDVWVIPEALREPIPDQIDGFPVVVRDSGGEVIALQVPD